MRGAPIALPWLRPGAGAARSRTGRLLSLLLGAVLALTAGLGSGASFAYWTTTGTGLGAATTGTPQAVTLVKATGTIADQLVPGGTADLLVALTNPNSFPVTITGIEQRIGPGLDVDASVAGCIVTGVTVAPQPALTLHVAGRDTAEVIVPDAASMSLASDSDCQGATFQIPVIVTVRS
jgi:hypothetical protein